jgi:hypothetical protein
MNWQWTKSVRCTSGLGDDEKHVWIRLAFLDGDQLVRRDRIVARTHTAISPSLSEKNEKKLKQAIRAQIVLFHKKKS